MILFLAALLTQAIHVSSGPHGFVMWIQPQHIAAGVGIVHWHIVNWFQVQ